MLSVFRLRQSVVQLRGAPVWLWSADTPVYPPASHLYKPGTIHHKTTLFGQFHCLTRDFFQFCVRYPDILAFRAGVFLNFKAILFHCNDS